MIPKNRVSNTDMASDALVEAPIREDAERGGEMLLAVQTLLLQRVELRVRADLQLLAGLRLAQRLHRAVLLRVGVVDVEGWCHFFFLFFKIKYLF